MAQASLDMKRVEKLLEALRRHTSDEISAGVLDLGEMLTPEMRCALDLLATERETAKRPEAAE